MLVFALASLALAEPTAPADPVKVGDVAVTPVYHGTVVLQHGDQTVWVDPWSKAALDSRPKADVVLLTDIHPDHLDAAALAKVSKEGTVIVAPQAVADTLEGPKVNHVLANGASHQVGALGVEAVPMYNHHRGPEEGQLFHVKGRGNGYVVTIGGQRIYIAGDTACTDEMKALEGIDLALVPMNLPYTMPPEEAVPCVKAMKPKMLVPYHYAGSDLSVLAPALEGSGVEVKLVDAYPGGLPW